MSDQFKRTTVTLTVVLTAATLHTSPVPAKRVKDWLKDALELGRKRGPVGYSIYRKKKQATHVVFDVEQIPEPQVTAAVADKPPPKKRRKK